MLSTKTTGDPRIASQDWALTRPGLFNQVVSGLQSLWPAEQSQADGSLRTVAVANGCLTLLAGVLFYRSATIWGLGALYLILNLAGVAALTYKRKLLAEGLLLVGAPLMAYLGVAIMAPAGKPEFALQARIILTALAVTPFLVLDLQNKAGLVLLTLFHIVLLVSIDSAILHMPVKASAGIRESELNRGLTSVVAVGYAGFQFLLYRLRSSAKDQQIQYLVEALTDSAVSLSNLNQDLRESQAALEEANMCKDRLFSIIAHDLRMPMGTFQSFSSLLVEHSDKLSTEDVRDMTIGMRRSFDQLKSMLDNLLSWSQNQLNHLEARPVPVQLCDTLEAMVGFYQIACQDKDLQVMTRCNPKLRVETDPELFNTVLRNLLSNAIKFSRPGQRIELTAEAATQGKVCIRVRDFGIGMSLAAQAQLFTLGNRKSQRGTKGEKGTGLGTVLVRDFLRLMGSELYVESQPDNGTSAWFYLPAVV